jgi:hypothetical protein
MYYEMNDDPVIFSYGDCRPCGGHDDRIVKLSWTCARRSLKCLMMQAKSRGLWLC